VRTAAQRLLQQSGIHKVPTPWRELFERLNVRRVIARDIAIEGGLTRTGDGRFEIVVRKDCSPHRTRFTIAHELGHILFYQYAPRAKREQALQGVRAPRAEELLCNLVAEELLMPSWYMAAFNSLQLSVVPHALRRIAYECAVSLRAACIRLAPVISLPGALQLWERQTNTWRLALHCQLGDTKLPLRTFEIEDWRTQRADGVCKDGRLYEYGWIRSEERAEVTRASTLCELVGPEKNPRVLVVHALGKHARDSIGTLEAFADRKWRAAAMRAPSRACLLCGGTGFAPRDSNRVVGLCPCRLVEAASKPAAQ
jgi:hypothetical protein